MVEEQDSEGKANIAALREVARAGIADMDAGRARTFASAAPLALKFWTVRITAVAETDFQEILRWSTANFGAAQSQADGEALAQAIDALTGGPDIVAAMAREDIGNGLLALRVPGNDGDDRYFVLFRVNQIQAQQCIDVLRILHRALDPGRG